MPAKQSNPGDSCDLPELQMKEDFPPHSYRKWRLAVEQGLKGKSFDSLSIATLEGYPSQPVFGLEDQARLGDMAGLPGQSPFLRGTHALGYRTHPWRIQSQIRVPDPSSVNKIARQELSHGSSGIEIGVCEATDPGAGPDQHEADRAPHQQGVTLHSCADLGRVMDHIDPTSCEVFFDCSDGAYALAAQYLALMKQRGIAFHALRGGFLADPLGALVHHGVLACTLEQRYQEMASLARWCQDSAPELRCIRVCSKPYHNAGGNAVQEVGFAIATGAEYLRTLMAHGVSADQAASQISFSFALGTRFFTEVAKLRAARVLWDQVTEAFGCGSAARAMVIHAQTSSWNMSKLDPWVNILRATVEAFAAVIGGVDSLTILPYDELNGLPDEHSRRLCRNTQLILRDESFLAKVVDPAGGSWYVEHLSDVLGREAWRLFQRVEGIEGMTRAVQQGYPQQEVTRVALKRSGGIARRSEPFIGASKYANLGEEPLRREQINWDQVHADRLEAVQAARAAADQDLVQEGLQRLSTTAGASVERMAVAIDSAAAGATVEQLSGVLRVGDQIDTTVALGLHRGAESIEKLRQSADEFQRRTGGRPRVYLAPWGPVAEHRTITEFAVEFLESGGFEVIRGAPATSTAQAAEAVLADSARVVVICAKQERYAGLVTELSPQLKGRILVVAGPPPAEFSVAWTQHVEEFIHARADVVSVLTRLQRVMEVVS